MMPASIELILAASARQMDITARHLYMGSQLRGGVFTDVEFIWPALSSLLFVEYYYHEQIINAYQDTENINKSS